MFDAFYELEDEGAEMNARNVLEAGGEVKLMGLGLRHDRNDLLVVRVTSSQPPERISSGTAFADMTRAEAILDTATWSRWLAKLLAEQRVELRLTDSAGKVWWSADYGRVEWPAGIEFPIKTNSGWL